MNEYSLEQAQKEAEKIQAAIKSGKANSYGEAENIIDKENRIEKVPRIVLLYIDDYGPIIKFIKHAFRNDNRILAIQCQSKKEAIDAIEKYRPHRLLIDNSFEEGNDGLVVVDYIKAKGDMDDMVIISITGDGAVVPEYEKRGIERMDKKNDILKITSIMNDFEAEQNKK